MHSRARLRLLADFFAATRNEIAIDEMFLALSKVNAEVVGHFPRVPHWIGLAIRRPYMARTLFRITQVLWLAGGSALFFLWEYLKFSRLHRSNRAFALPMTDGAILGLSTRVCDIVTTAQFPMLPRTWLTLPWVPMRKIPDGAKELPMLSVLDKGDFLLALADALIATQRMRRNRRLSSWVLHTYTSFRWFLVRRAIDRLSGTLVTTEHFDRWAVLVDRAVRECRRIQDCRTRLIVVQHGAMGVLNQEHRHGDSLLNLPTRLGQVDELYAYSSNEVEAFRAKVFVAVKASHAQDIHFFKPAIELTGEVKSDRPRLLFVGHPLCEGFQIEVFLKLKAWKNFEVYYKPHPKASMSTTIAEVEWIIIKEENVFPRVDLLVSYPSTLVIEYEGRGIPASVHPLDASVAYLPNYVERTQEIIENIMSEWRH